MTEKIKNLLVTILEAELFLQKHSDAMKTTYAEMSHNMLKLIAAVNDHLEDTQNIAVFDFAKRFEQAKDESECADFLAAVGQWIISVHCKINGISTQEWQTENENITEPYDVPMPEQERPEIRNRIDVEWIGICDFVHKHDKQQIVYQMKKALQMLKKQSSRVYQQYVNGYNTYAHWGKIDLQRDWYGVFEERAEILKEHITDLEWLYLQLADYRSKRVLLSILRNWIFCDMEGLHEAKENGVADYFDPDLILCDEQEVFVDVGAFVGDTVLNYIREYPAYRKIYCYEMTPATFETLKQNLKTVPNVDFRQKAAFAQSGEMQMEEKEDAAFNALTENGIFSVEAVALDDDIKEPITFLKMDIEGAEQQALLGCKHHIAQEQPKLAISTYHNNMNLWKIPRMIYAMNPNYRFYMRYHGGNLIPTKYVLLGI